MKELVRLVSACSIVLFGATAGPTAVSAAPSHEEEGASAADSAHRRVIERVLAELELRPEQQERIDVLLAEGERRYQPVREAKGNLMMAVADQVEKGKVDRCNLTSEIGELSAAMAAVHPDNRAALEQLHAMLDREQRGRFVGAIRREWRLFERQHDPLVMAEEISGKLRLSEAQELRIRQVLYGVRMVREAQPTYTERRERWSNVLEAFKGDRFVMDEVAPMRNVAEQCSGKIEGILGAVDAMLPVLDEEQRLLLAQKLRQKAQEQRREIGGAPSMSPVVD